MTKGGTAAKARRVGLLAGKVGTDSVRAVTRRSENGSRGWDASLDDGVKWLERTHDVTGRRGSSRGYSLLTGWAPAFPETSGYLIGTLIAYAQPRQRDDLLLRARELGDWEIEVQNPDGGVMQGLITRSPRRSIAFNTGMVLHGWLDLYRVTRERRYLAAAQRAGRWLIEHQQADGTWRGAASYRGVPHTYKSRVSWALIRLADATGQDEFRRTAVRNLDWVISTQRPNGWFDQCEFEPGTLPNTHGIAYTLRGLVESYALLREERYLDCARRTSTALIGEFTRRRSLPATWAPDWTPGSRYRCLTGIAQLGGVWLRMHELTDEEEFKQAGIRAVEHAATFQLRGPNADLSGALPGSFPVYGRYAPLACPNWATKFLVDGLMLRARAGAVDEQRVVWG